MSVKEKKIKEQETLLRELREELLGAEDRLKKTKVVVKRHKRVIRDTKSKIAAAEEWLSALTETPDDSATE